MTDFVKTLIGNKPFIRVQAFAELANVTTQAVYSSIRRESLRCKNVGGILYIELSELGGYKARSPKRRKNINTNTNTNTNTNEVQS